MADHKSVDAIVTSAEPLSLDEIKLLQTALTESGDYDDEIDGLIGQGTSAGLVAYIENHPTRKNLIRSINTDILVEICKNKDTWNSFLTSARQMASLPDVTRNLYRAKDYPNPDDSVPAIKALQECLNLAQYKPGSIDGDFGPQTKAAIKNFQKDDARRFSVLKQSFQEASILKTSISKLFQTVASAFAAIDLKRFFQENAEENTSTLLENFNKNTNTNGPPPTTTPPKASHNISDDVRHALQEASEQTGFSYDFLKNLAKAESSFNPKIVNPASKASGLMQIIPGPIMYEMVHKYAENSGLDYLKPLVERYSKKNSKGETILKYRAASDEDAKTLRNELFNPRVSALLVAYNLKDYEESMSKHLGHPLNQTELYCIHFLGYGGSKRFLKACNDPDHKYDLASNHVSKLAAAQNPTILGNGNTVETAYKILQDKMGINPVYETTPDQKQPHNTLLATGPAV